MNLPARASVVLGAIAWVLVVANEPAMSSTSSVAGIVSGGIGWMLSKQGACGDYNWAVGGIVLSGLALVIVLAVVTEFLS